MDQPDPTEPHDPRYKIREWTLWALMGLLLLTNYFHVNSWYDREAMRRDLGARRSMLDARAVIQVTLARAANRGGQLHPDEKALIQSLWSKAEYDKVITKEALD